MKIKYSENETNKKLNNISTTNQKSISITNKKVSLLNQMQNQLKNKLELLTSIYNSTVQNLTQILSEKIELESEVAKMKDDLKNLQNKVNKIEDSSESEHKIMELWKKSLIPKNVIFEPINSYGLFYMLPKHNDYR